MEQILKELHTIGDFIRWGASEFNKAELFFGHGTDNAIDDAAVLVLHTLNLPHEIPDILWHSRLTSSEKQQIYNILQRRIKEAIPTPYLTNEAWFSNLRFYVDSRVLIPRSPIAELIEQSFEPWVEADQVNYMLDLCTGSGCIAIASAVLAFPNAKIDAVDISADALDVAKKNIEAYGLTEQVDAIQSDLFSNLNDKKYDLIVCNPPYVDAEELATMPKEYHHEPRLGLEAGDNGLLFVEQILRQAAKYLTPDGILIVEVGLSQKYLMEHELPFMWLDFQRGGEGVFLLTAKQLIEYV